MPSKKKTNSSNGKAPVTTTPEAVKKAPVEVTPSLVVYPVPPVVIHNEAATIWNEIKDVQLNMFALPDQTVQKYCKPITVEPSKLYVTLTASAALSALEDNLGKRFTFTPAGKYLIISRK